MKVTIELTDAEVGGIKDYLGELGEPTNKEGIIQFIQGIVFTNLYSPAESVSGYIKNKNNG